MIDANTQAVVRQYLEGVAFNKFLGMRLIQLEATHIQFEFDMRPELVGNPVHQILHGGVTSAVLDQAGGLMAMVSLVADIKITSFEQALPHIQNLGTIDLRVDYIHPGRGEVFTATAQILRRGRKIAVTRMELHNEQQKLIAAGTATYLVG